MEIMSIAGFFGPLAAWYKWKSQFWIGLDLITLDFPFISEELADKSNSELWFLLVDLLNTDE
jgi:hypothetical protein